MTIAIGNGKRDGWIGDYAGRPMKRSTNLALQLGSPLGNPFKPGSRTPEGHGLVVDRYRDWLKTKIQSTDSESQRIRIELQRLTNIVRLGKKELRLDCWCAPLPCHGEVIRETIEWAIATDYNFLATPAPTTIFSDMKEFKKTLKARSLIPLSK